MTWCPSSWSASSTGISPQTLQGLPQLRTATSAGQSMSNKWLTHSTKVYSSWRYPGQPWRVNPALVHPVGLTKGVFGPFSPKTCGSAGKKSAWVSLPMWETWVQSLGPRKHGELVPVLWIRDVSQGRKLRTNWRKTEMPWIHKSAIPPCNLVLKGRKWSALPLANHFQHPD